MRRVRAEATWPESWRLSYAYDLEEVYGEITHRGYAGAYRERRRHTLNLIAEVLPPGSRILDIAAAQGNFSIALAEMGYRVTWNDLRAELADYVRLKHERGDLAFAPGNAFDLPFERAFDAVLATEIIEHVAHPDRFLANVAALVRPDGHIVLTTPNGAYFRNRLPKFSDCPDPGVFEAGQFKPNADGHIFLLYPDELRDLSVRAGLELERLLLFTNPLTIGHVRTERLLGLLPASLVRAVEQGTRRLPLALHRRLMFQMGARLRKPG
jgi:2-polyprenyl-6-hydroxyphenyl methylase/3-demethylubiquinone-9 3-methyltransferase